MSISLLPQGLKLHNRIAWVYMGLMMAALALSFAWLWQQAQNYAQISQVKNLDAAEEVLAHLLTQQNHQLSLSATALANAPELFAALERSSRSAATAALQRQARLMQVDQGLLLDKHFNLIAHTPSVTKALLPSLKRVALQARLKNTSQTGIEWVHGQALHLAISPLKGNEQLGWVGVITHIDHDLLIKWQQLLDMNVAILGASSDGQFNIIEASTDGDLLTQLQHTWRTHHSHADLQDLIANPQPINIGLNEQTLSGRLLNSSSEVASQVQFLLLREDQRTTLLRRAWGLALLVCLLGSMVALAAGLRFTQRHVTQPLLQLAHSVRKLEEGDYNVPIRIQDEHEIGELAHSVEAMRQAIQQRESEIRRLAFEDTLTSLPNREQFRQSLRLALSRAQITESTCCVLMLDMDRFKQVNDVLGHRFGDRLLQAVAERLRLQTRPFTQATLARLSGDEFAILLPEVNTTAALNLAQRILRSMESPLTLDEHTVDVSAGIGIACSPLDGQDADLLMNRAEIAMYVAKQQQLGAVPYDASMDSSSEESLTLLSELRQAIDSHQLRLFLQPKIDLKTKEVIGAEALVRWAHPVRGMVPPIRFIPFAEQSGFIRAITMWVIEEAAQTAKQFQQQQLNLKIAANLSTRDLMDPELPNKVERVLQRHRLRPGTLMLEITESSIMDDPQRALLTLDRLHSLGVKLSIDDFGTGYSSLAYLKRLPVDELKIDQSFVKHMESDLDDAKIVRSTIDLAHNLNLRVVAEGVETAKTWKLLEGLNCDEAQGYFMAKPMPAAEFTEWLKTWSAPQTDGEYLDSEFSAMLI